jgi:ribosomal protein S18 acetylase RimI-like enzyme
VECHQRMGMSGRGENLKKAGGNTMKTMTRSLDKKRVESNVGEKKNPTTKIDFTNILGQVAHFRIFQPDERDYPIGYVLVTHEGPEAIMWNIYVDPKFRKRGYASRLIDALKGTYDYILTSYTSEHGKRLCQANGFKFDPKTNFLEWSRKNDAK